MQHTANSYCAGCHHADTQTNTLRAVERKENHAPRRPCVREGDGEPQGRLALREEGLDCLLVTPHQRRKQAGRWEVRPAPELLHVQSFVSFTSRASPQACRRIKRVSGDLSQSLNDVIPQRRLDLPRESRCCTKHYCHPPGTAPGDTHRAAHTSLPPERMREGECECERGNPDHHPLPGRATDRLAASSLPSPAPPVPHLRPSFFPHLTQQAALPSLEIPAHCRPSRACQGYVMPRKRKLYQNRVNRRGKSKRNLEFSAKRKRKKKTK
ncbi:hypothetical protein E2C01_025767 [Portunus trituberculatus]|uniref:Uncharacterized protein n=1 Tax=Portunus trituberculatus TaxID=210409 RepID=A0A5B7EGM3_PORTR|nr:hypothetical protein [Portunus trituberculatus]